jgi:hypothetical protein
VFSYTRKEGIHQNKLKNEPNWQIPEAYWCSFTETDLKTRTLLILSRIYSSVTKNNGSWTGWSDLLTPYFTISLNHNQLQKFTNNDSLRLVLILFILWLLVQVQVTLRLTVSQSVSLGVEPHLGPMTIRILLASNSTLLYPLFTDPTENSLYCCTHYPAMGCFRRICLRGNEFIEPLPSNGSIRRNIMTI